MKSINDLTGKLLRMSMLAVFSTCMALSHVNDAMALSTCAIGFLQGGSVVINGQDDSTEVGHEWDDASVLASGDDCLDQLSDKDAAGTGTELRNVNVKSKRFVKDDQWYYGFFFHVGDLSNTGPCPGTQVCKGERIILQFNGHINGDDEIQTEDKRVVLTHKWVASGAEIALTKDVFKRQDDPGSDASCTKPKWQADTSGTDGVDSAARVSSGGYDVEVEVPASFIDSPDNDIGVAFAVINDFGEANGIFPDLICSGAPTASCVGSGIAFPNDLLITTEINPVDLYCNGLIADTVPGKFDWITPAEWGLGYTRFEPGMGDVTVAGSPSNWSSDSIKAFQCDSATEGYTYYPTRPCRARIRAGLKNTGPTTTRNILYLWAEHGTGNPAEYHFVDLVENAVVAGAGDAGGGVPVPAVTQVDSLEWNDVPRNKPNHPCLRVYVLPASIDPAYDRTELTKPIQTRTEVEHMMSVYGLGSHHWSQKNISRHSTVTECPTASCRVTGSLFDRINLDFTKSAYADNHMTHMPDMAAHTDPGSMPKNIKMTAADWKKYSGTNVIVQARTFGYKKTTGSTGSYVFIEEMGGVIQMYPLDMVQERRELPFEFTVTNSDNVPISVRTKLDVHLPPSVPNVHIDYESGVVDIQPGTTRTITGTVVNSDIPKVCGCLDILCHLKKIFD